MQPDEIQARMTVFRSSVRIQGDPRMSSILGRPGLAAVSSPERIMETTDSGEIEDDVDSDVSNENGKNDNDGCSDDDSEDGDALGFVKDQAIVRSSKKLFRDLKVDLVKQQGLLPAEEQAAFEAAWGIDSATGYFVNHHQTFLCWNTQTTVRCVSLVLVIPFMLGKNKFDFYNISILISYLLIIITFILLIFAF